ncbi:MAG: hypothetical protein LBQ58_11165 [Synergistaceae bacterium]|jgi:hypothetical protein|nr:hypothetical protein [Synergistaceae bacterium]
MSDIYSLERELRGLRDQLQSYKKQTAKMQRDYEDDLKRKIAAMEDESARAIAARDLETAGKYEASLREYQGEVGRKMLEMRLHEDAEYNRLRCALSEAEHEWDEKNRMMERLIAELKEGRAESERVSSSSALDSIKSAESVYELVERTPHELFFPNRLPIFGNAIEDAKDLQKNGLNEAAAAVSISTRFSVERLGYDIEDLRGEWERLFSAFCGRARALIEALHSEIAEWAALSEGAHIDWDKMSPDDRKRRMIEVNYWSKGEFADIWQSAEKYGKWMDCVNDMGIDKYLKTDEAVSIDALSSDIDKLSELKSELDKLKVLYKARCEASCQRADWGKALIDFMTGEINLILIEPESGYRYAPPEVLRSDSFRDYIRQAYGDESLTEDTREWLELAFENASLTRIYIYIVPAERDGEVKNSVIIYTEHTAGRDIAFDKEIYFHVLEAMSMSEDDGAVGFADDLEYLSNDRENIFYGAVRSLKEKLQNHS